MKAWIFIDPFDGAGTLCWRKACFAGPVIFYSILMSGSLFLMFLEQFSLSYLFEIAHVFMLL
jgi:hypothetical protein